MFLNDNSDDYLNSFDVDYGRIFQIRKGFSKEKDKPCTDIDTQFLFLSKDKYHFEIDTLVTFKFILKSQKHNNEFYNYMLKMEKKFFPRLSIFRIFKRNQKFEKITHPFTRKYYYAWFDDLHDLKERRMCIYKDIFYKHLLDELPSVNCFIWLDANIYTYKNTAFKDFTVKKNICRLNHPNWDTIPLMRKKMNIN